MLVLDVAWCREFGRQYTNELLVLLLLARAPAARWNEQEHLEQPAVLEQNEQEHRPPARRPCSNSLLACATVAGAGRAGLRAHDALRARALGSSVLELMACGEEAGGRPELRRRRRGALVRSGCPVDGDERRRPELGGRVGRLR